MASEVPPLLRMQMASLSQSLRRGHDLSSNPRAGGTPDHPPSIQAVRSRTPAHPTAAPG